VLLFVMALMVNYGTMATWRVRSEVISRHSAWRERWPRSGRTEGPPKRPFWPEDAVMTTEPDVRPDILDVPEINHPVVRGPIPNDFVVRPILDPTRGAYKGVSEVNREYPMLPRLGDYKSGDVDTPLIDRKWQNAEMGIPNRFRRTKVIYELPKTDPSLPQAFSQAVEDLLSIPHYDALRILERDEDIRKYRGGYVDFHPRIGRGCEIDPEVVRREHVERLIDTRGSGDIRLGQISRLPRRMTNFFLSMYRGALRRLQAELNGMPPPSPQRRGEIQREISELELKIQQLEDYQARLPQIEDDLRARAAAVL
jgi:hypothetical protein